MTTITSGIVTTMEAARIVPQGCSCSLAPLNWEITTGTVFMVSVTVNVRANKSSIPSTDEGQEPYRNQAGRSEFDLKRVGIVPKRAGFFEIDSVLTLVRFAFR